MEYKADLAAIDDLIAAMRGLVGFAEQALTEIDDKVQELHTADPGGSTPWTGDAADAYSRAHATWMDGAQKMRDGLAAMEKAGQNAHASYDNLTTQAASLLGRTGQTGPGTGGRR